LFRDAAVASKDTVVTYCHIGMQASLLYLTARRLGFEAKLYDGSFEEWSRRSELPVTNRATAKQ
jgi:thiosulfate/3-mercaptopyruvate sulfurtransferase